MTEIVRKIEDLFGKKMDVTVKSAGLNKEYTCNNSRLLAEMPNFKFMSFDEALANLYNWYIAHKDTIDSKKLLFDK